MAAKKNRPAAAAKAAAPTSAASAVDKVAQRQRALQRKTDAEEPRSKAKTKKTAPTQAGTRRQPQRMPSQHLRKPGDEKDLLLQPRFEAPDYVGSGKLRGMSAIVTGADSGIGRAVAVLFAREGADVAVLYLNEHDDAQLTRAHVEKEGRRCLTIAGDVKDPSSARTRWRRWCRRSAGWTCWSTTPRSSCTATRWRT